jgi:hypothetical protein
LVPEVSVPAVTGRSTEADQLPPLSMLMMLLSLILLVCIVSPASKIVLTVELAVKPLPLMVIRWLATAPVEGVDDSEAEPIVMLVFNVLGPAKTI